MGAEEMCLGRAEVPVWRENMGLVGVGNGQGHVEGHGNGWGHVWVGQWMGWAGHLALGFVAAFIWTFAGLSIHLTEPSPEGAWRPQGAATPRATLCTGTGVGTGTQAWNCTRTLLARAQASIKCSASTFS